MSEFISCDSSFFDAKICIFGVPYDCTTSYRPGARFGPASIRSESYGIETWSPYQNRDLEDCAICDCGDLETPFGPPQPMLEMVRQKTEEILKAGKLPFMLGGEHLITLGAVRACAKQHPNLHIIHFDAHADLRQEYLGQELSHATVMRRCYDILGEGRIFQFGIRSGDREEFAFVTSHSTCQNKFDFAALPQVLETINQLSDNKKPVPVYFTLDLDVLDPSEFPGTGTPEAGGVTFRALLDAILLIGQKCRLVGCDMMELAPNLDVSGRSTALACKLLREMLLCFYQHL